MEAYFMGQRVEIIAIENEHLRVRYPAIAKYVGNIGIVVEVYTINLKALGRENNYYSYCIRLGQSNRVIAAPHGALKRCFDNES
jgi:hypothetical protein